MKKTTILQQKSATFSGKNAHHYAARIHLRSEYLKKDGTTAVAMQVTINGKRKSIPLGISIDPACFDRKTQRVRLPNPQQTSDLNLLLSQAIDRATTLFIEARLADRVLTVKQFTDQYNRAERGQSFIAWARQYIPTLNSIHSISYIRYLHRSITYLEHAYGDLAFSQLTREVAIGYGQWLKSQNRYSYNYQIKLQQAIKTLILAAQQEGIRVHNIYEHVRLKRKPVERVYLDTVELQQLIDLYDQETRLPPTMRTTLQAFLFSATSGGFRLSDLKRLTTQNLNGSLLMYVPYKTRKHKTRVIKLQLPDIGHRLITAESGYLFPLVEDPVANRHLKELGAMVGLKKNLHMHVARHTFATQYLEHGGKVEKLQRILGHSRINETMIYVHLIDKSVEQSMQVMNFFK